MAWYSLACHVQQTATANVVTACGHGRWREGRQGEADRAIGFIDNESANLEEFAQSGREALVAIRELVDLEAHFRVVTIGCGMGRIEHPLATEVGAGEHHVINRAHRQASFGQVLRAFAHDDGRAISSGLDRTASSDLRPAARRSLAILVAYCDASIRFADCPCNLRVDTGAGEQEGERSGLKEFPGRQLGRDKTAALDITWPLAPQSPIIAPPLNPTMTLERKWNSDPTASKENWPAATALISSAASPHNLLTIDRKCTVSCLCERIAQG